MYYDEELQPDFRDFYDGFDDYDVSAPGGSDEVFSKLTSLQELFRYCLKPTIFSAYSQLLHIFLVCLLFRLIVEFLRLPDVVRHILSALAGIYIHWFYFEYLGLHILGVALGGFGLVKTFEIVLNRSRGFAVLTSLLAYLIILQQVLQKDGWMKIQGPLMIVVMKIVSYAFDCELGSIAKSNFTQYAGYSMNPGTCIFGPWVSFSDYAISLSEQEKWSVRLLKRIASIAIKSLGFFALSVCLIEWAIADTSSAGWLMYRDALLFRTGQYFVSLTSELSATLAGHSTVTVTNPWAIELPHSLVDVVINWNAPVHKWLKTYIFKTTMPQAGIFIAVMNTYIVSSLLHGVNIRLSAILLSLGLYTFVEHRIRRKLAHLLNACVGPRPCRSPCSKHKRNAANNILINAANQTFTILAVFHLAYLGCIMNTQTTTYPLSQNLNDRPFQRWSDALYSSHFIVLITFGIYCVISLFQRTPSIHC